MFLKQRFSLDLSYRVALLPDYQPLLEKITRQMQPFLWIFLLFGCFQTLLFKIHATLLTVYEEKGCIRHLLAFKEVFCIKNSLPVPLYSSNSVEKQKKCQRTLDTNPCVNLVESPGINRYNKTIQFLFEIIHRKGCSDEKKHEMVGSSVNLYGIIIFLVFPSYSRSER